MMIIIIMMMIDHLDVIIIKMMMIIIIIIMKIIMIISIIKHNRRGRDECAGHDRCRSAACRFGPGRAERTVYEEARAGDDVAIGEATTAASGGAAAAAPLLAGTRKLARENRRADDRILSSHRDDLGPSPRSS